MPKVMQGRGGKSVAELGLNPAWVQLVPVATPGIEGVYVRVLMEKWERKRLRAGSE